MTAPQDRGRTIYRAGGLRVWRGEVCVAEWSPSMTDWLTIEGQTTTAELRVIRRAGYVTAHELADLLEAAA